MNNFYGNFHQFVCRLSTNTSRVTNNAPTNDSTVASASAALEAGWKAIAQRRERDRAEIDTREQSRHRLRQQDRGRREEGY